MKIEKQKKVLECFTSGKYRCVKDEVYYKERKTGIWKPIVGNRLLRSGYIQIIFTTPAAYGNSELITCYKHIAIYIANNGLYKEGWQIDHLDRNNQNNLPNNLEAKPPIDNIANSKRVVFCSTKPISNVEKDKIKELMQLRLSQSEIARRLKRKRITVRRYIKSFETTGCI